MEILAEPFIGLMGEQWIGRVVIKDRFGPLLQIGTKIDIAMRGLNPVLPGEFSTMDVILPQYLGSPVGALSSFWVLGSHIK